MLSALAVITVAGFAPATALSPQRAVASASRASSGASVPGGTQLWASKYHGNNQQNYGEAVAASPDGASVYVTGVTGVAPLEVSSAGRVRHRLNRGGNRQLNAALHRITVVQARCHPGAAALLERRGQDKHETRKASLRVLKRHLSDVIYRALNADAWRLGQPAPHAA